MQLTSLRRLLLLAAVLAIQACSKAPEPVKPGVPGATIEDQTISFPKDSPQLSTLRTVPIERERDSFVRINGRISWDDSRTSRITSPVAGKVVELRVMPGCCSQERRSAGHPLIA